MNTITTIIDSDLLLPIMELPAELRHRKVEVTVQAPVASESTKENKPWFTPEELAQFKQNRLKLEEKIAKKPNRVKEELRQLLLQCPVASEEEIKMQAEFREDLKRWIL